MKKLLLFLLILPFAHIAFAQPETHFVTTWDTNFNGSTDNTHIRIPTTGTGYDYDVDWNNDGIFDEFELTGSVDHDFGAPGEYTIRIKGSFPRIHFGGANGGDKSKFINVEQWGSQVWTSMHGAFTECDHFIGNDSPIPAPNLTSVTDMTSIFNVCKVFNGDISNWDVSGVDKMRYAFHNAYLFNKPLAEWEVDNVEDFEFMFKDAWAFNQDIGSWITTSATVMRGMFWAAKEFNQNIDSWHVLGITDMSYMFYGAEEFNFPLDSWDVDNVETMAQMFGNAIAFDQPLPNWNVESVQDMSSMFSGASSFNGSIDNWDVSLVENMSFMFKNASSFNQPLSLWNNKVGSVTNFESMFQNAMLFDQNLPFWDVSSATNMKDMFKGVTLSQSNYDALLQGFFNHPVQNNVQFHGGNSKFCAGSGSRYALKSQFNWQIKDGGPNCPGTEDHFVTTWKIGNGFDSGIVIPTASNRTYNYDVDWDNDGIFDEFGKTSFAGHDFSGEASAGELVTVRIRGTFPAVDFFNYQGISGDAGKKKLRSIDQWGVIQWETFNGAFYGCENMQIEATDAPDLSGVTDMWHAFDDCTSLNQNIGHWNMSSITTITGMFDGASAFNGDISSWVLSNVNVMGWMFRNATSFNQPIGSWDVTSVQSMTETFKGATSFNQDLSDWELLNVNSTRQMFRGASSFNQDISGWDISNIGDLEEMFRDATSFDQNLGAWDFNLAVLHPWGRLEYFVSNTGLSVANYDDLLIGLAAKVAANENFPTYSHKLGASSLGYCRGAAARQQLIDEYGWTILDSGQECNEEDQLILKWITNHDDGPNYTRITIPTQGNGYNYDVDINNDGIFDVFGKTGDFIINFGGIQGVKTIRINGDFPRLYFNSAEDKDKLIGVVQWGSEEWETMEDAFNNCPNLVELPLEAPNLSSCSSLKGMFQDVPLLNEDISNWNVSSVEDMSNMFKNASLFDQNLDGWNVGSVNNMAGMFASANSFNKSLSSWNVSSVVNMSSMFNGATSFDQDISNWVVNSVTNISGMFKNAPLFNCDIGVWEFNTLSHAREAFEGATSFNQDLDGWNMSHIINTDLRRMFKNASSFNGMIGSWDVSGVDRMEEMFMGASAFNQDIGLWVPSNVQYMDRMFMDASAFNQDIRGWNVETCEEMNSMFENAISFDQNIGDWNIITLYGTDDMFLGAELATHNYDSLLIGWSEIELESGLDLHAGTSTYCNGEEARDYLINVEGWTFDDNGLDCSDSDSDGIFDADDNCMNDMNTDQADVDLDGLGDACDDDIDGDGHPNEFDCDPNDPLEYVGASCDDGNSNTSNDLILPDCSCGGFEVNPGDHFVTLWKTDNFGTSSNTSITIPTFTGETYSYDVDWDNDGTFDDFGLTGTFTHDYGAANTYIVRIRGTFPRIFFDNGGDKDKLLEVMQWGSNPWVSMQDAFQGCSNLQVNTTTSPNLNDVTSCNDMFRSCTMLNSDLNDWNVSNVTEMRFMFNDCENFNQDLNDWNVSNVTDMTSMFRGAINFNGNISSWNTSALDKMTIMFTDASAFNQDIGGWNTSNVSSMTQAFKNATSFDQDLSNWDVTNVSFMSAMFDGVQLSTTNYDKLLIGWSQQTLNNSPSFSAGNSMYCEGAAAKQSMINNNAWGFVDGGEDPTCPSFTHFVTTWKTNNSGSSTSTSITIPTASDETYSYNVDWNNDGIFDEFDLTGDVTHDFGSAGSYTIRIKGEFPRIHFNDAGDKTKLLSIDQWGTNSWTGMEDAFMGCENLQVLAPDTPDLSNTNSTHAMFHGCSNFNENIDNWDVSTITDMSFMFSGASDFNQPLISWDVSNVESMTGMFKEASAFNQSLDNWATGNVTSMRFMFQDAGAFNGQINGNGGSQGSWQLTSLTSTRSMFDGATSFNTTISNWDVSGVTTMSNMFRNATNFDQNLANWQVSNVINLSGMFENITLSLDNYDDLLISWSAQNLNPGLNFDGGNSNYCQGESARETLEIIHGWSMTDGGLDCLNYADLGDFVWEDINQNGIQDFGESGVPNVMVRLMAVGLDGIVGTADDLEVESTTTDPNGNYLFTQVSPDEYFIEIELSTLPSGWEFSPVDQGGIGELDSDFHFDGRTDSFFALSGQGNDLTFDAGVADSQFLVISQNFVTSWKTDNPGVSGNTSITIPTILGETYLYDVDWDNDGTFDEFGLTGDVTHDFGVAGIYTIQIQGDFPRIHFNNGGDKEKILQVFSWGNGSWTSMEDAFHGCVNLNGDALYPPDLTQVSDLSRMFKGASLFNADLQYWNTQAVSEMDEMFFGASSFNSNISNWPVFIVENFTGMFEGASSFNQDLSQWITFSATSLDRMFAGASSFDQNLDHFYIGNLTSAMSMFEGITLSTDNYDSLLIGWAGQTLQPGIVFDGGNSLYCSGTIARQGMIDNHSWIISDGGLDLDCEDDPSSHFVTTWQTDLPGATSGAELLIFVPSGGGYNYDIDWNNDGIFDEIGLTSSAIHDYEVADIYTVRIRGTFPQIQFGATFERSKLLSVDQWGDQQWISMYKAFELAENMNVLATDSPDLSVVTDMSDMFSNCTAMNGDISSWDVSNVNNMRRMFWAADSFNQDLDTWDVSSVTNMEEMFISADAFNGQIGSWDVGSVINMSSMLAHTSFNQNINNWNVSQVIDMGSMFLAAENYNQPMDNWDVGNVTTMSLMLAGCEVFNEDISGWDVSNVENMSSMFVNTFAFDQNIGAWDISNVTNMSNMFGGAQLSTTNYDFLLIGWSTQTLQPGVTFDGGNSQFCEGEAARQSMIDNDLWIITDGDEDPLCSTACYQTDKDILQQLHLALGEPVLTGWDFTPEAILDESWQGIGMSDGEGCQVDSLNLNNLGLVGSIDAIGNLTALRYLRIGNNSFPAGIPSTFENHSSLEYINLTDNEMDGTGIPSFLGTISTLQYLYLGVNDFGGLIPSELGDLTNLKVLALDGNQLTGEIPVGMLDADMADMASLYLYNNVNLTGELTEEMGMMPSIQAFWIQNNNFVGCIPASFINYCGEDVRMQDNDLLLNNDFITFCSNGVGVCQPNCATDLDDDGDTDGDDFSIFLGNYGLACENPFCATDLDSDGDTDGDDFSIFLGNYGLDCE